MTRGFICVRIANSPSRLSPDDQRFQVSDKNKRNKIQSLLYIIVRIRIIPLINQNFYETLDTYHRAHQLDVYNTRIPLAARI